MPAHGLAHISVCIIGDADRANLMRWATRIIATHPPLVAMVRAHLATYGEVRARDFARRGKKQGTWWDRSHEKQGARSDVCRGRVDGYQT
jgi:uncharacterized protein YcaQ